MFSEDTATAIASCPVLTRFAADADVPFATHEEPGDSESILFQSSLLSSLNSPGGRSRELPWRVAH